MANIKNLQMWKTICTDARVCISKSFLGLCTKAVYTPTSSPIDVKTYEYTQADGSHLKLLLSQSENISSLIDDFCPKAIVNGNYMAEVCLSRDGNFVVVQLLQYSRTNYDPVTEPVIFEGDTAQAVKKIFQA